MRKRWVAPVLVLAALIGVAAATESWRRSRTTPESPSTTSRGSAEAFAPYPVEPFQATAIDGRDVSTSTWAGKVVVVNFWATWCAPCRREIPALAAMQRAHGDRLLVLGILDDNVTDDFARQFAAATGLTYPIVRTSWEIERRFPLIAALPMTFVVDRSGRIVSMHAGEIDPAQLEREIRGQLD
jgi:cytochrome c biogenesis protein CcmG/thiol:disulfide interchange protein DsbE